MLKFGQSELNWSDVASVSHSASGQVSVTTTDNEIVEIGQWDDQAKASTFAVLIASAKTAYAAGGIIIEVIIDDL